LQEENIFCFLKDEYSSTINPIYNNVTGGIKLMVDVNDVTAATDILLKIETEYLKTICCKKCGQQQIISVLAILEKNKFQKFISKIFNDKNIVTERYYQCEGCGWKGKSLES
jgi:predicted RNA-binding Zn-ribbon protein involved in translation (DUF1610 family)